MYHEQQTMQHLSFLSAFTFVKTDSEGKKAGGRVLIKKKKALLVFLGETCPLVKPFCCIYAANSVLMGFHVHFPDRWAVLFTKMNN